MVTRCAGRLRVDQPELDHGPVDQERDRHPLLPQGARG
jgi:hypothetical protein